MPLGLVYKDDVQVALKGFLVELMRDKRIQGVLVPSRMEKEGTYTYILTKEREGIEKSTPIAPIMPIQGARVLSKLTIKGALSRPVVAILRPCELRAAKELAKINQVHLESFLTVSFDCPGVYPLKNYRDEMEEIEKRFPEELKSFSLKNTRPLCKSCIYFTGDIADFEVQFANQKEVMIIARTEKAISILKELGKAQEVRGRSEEDISNIMENRKVNKDNFLKTFGSQVDTPDKILKVLSSCINCRNCRSVCPVCYCRECFFDSDALKTSPHLYIERAERKGGLRFLPDTLLFHLGRMNHMSLSCVSCGMCEDACPNMVPVGRLFSLVSERTRSIFGYVPGISVEPSPLLEYKTEELKEYEVPYHTARD